MAQLLDSNYLESVTKRLAAIPDDANPAWGILDKPALFEHLNWAVRGSMGREGDIPFVGNWLTRHIVRRLLMGGILTIPKNLKAPKALTDAGITLRSPGDLNDLRRCLDDFVTQADAGELQCAPHPAFGELGVDGWRRFHVLHFEHHCKQFGV